MLKGFLWYALNNDKHDYMQMSYLLAKSIKTHCKINSVCVITNTDKVPASLRKIADHVRIMKQDDSEHEEWKLGNEYKSLALTPYTHTIKLEADMLATANIDFWWYFLCQHNMVFSHDCYDYKGKRINKGHYRKLWEYNNLPNIYSGLTYFRKSKEAQKFFEICKFIYKNWEYVKENILIRCHDKNATTDMVFSLACKIADPLQNRKIDYDWFKFVHNKDHINDIPDDRDSMRYLNPIFHEGDVWLGNYRQHRMLHYHNKKYTEMFNE